MRGGVRLTALALAAALAATGCFAAEEEPTRPEPVAGGVAALPGPAPTGLALRPVPAGVPAAPAVAGRLTDGSPVELARLWADRPVVLVFFSSWCAACEQRQDALSQLARDHADRVVFVGVAGEDKPADVQRFLRAHRVDYPVLLDDGGRVALSYAVREPPAVVLVGRGGKLLRGWTGGVDASTLDARLRELVLAG
ncbi:TlpA family protein disulfide reductase [Micromonospora siamensis]|uniref:Cytochrome c biogenesis protein CcmG, thiol:disulfide interchange protein DsbE n=1 Tax=Micromonospora siamensis TaxID=299152 RepID=A0A1C5IQK4_9ACTN|nr:TlpA disulfide reductase family protein [Micromonospora siamensis]SCG60443.1 cytochrome c biogenesis protein CcmG, thiol:disulfide interchange protein DsbE [Micromonospora siamensis]